MGVRQLLGIAPMAQRTGREVIVVEGRGRDTPARRSTAREDRITSLRSVPVPNAASVCDDLGGADNVLPRTECAPDVRAARLDARRGEVSSPPCLRASG